MNQISSNTVKLRYLAACLDERRRSLSPEERAAKQGNIPYWDANGIADHVDESLFSGPLVLLREQGASFFDLLKPKAFYIDGEVWVSDKIHVLRPQKGVNAKYLVYALNAIDYSLYAERATGGNLTQDAMKEIRVPMPDTESQQMAIVDYIENEAKHIDALVAEGRNMVKLLEEKRVALINAAVTGQISAKEMTK